MSIRKRGTGMLKLWKWIREKEERNGEIKRNWEMEIIGNDGNDIIDQDCRRDNEEKL